MNKILVAIFCIFLVLNSEARTMTGHPELYSLTKDY